MNFSKALDALKAGKRLVRREWLGVRPRCYVHLIKDSPTSRYLAMSDLGKPLHPWTPTTEDVLADDWEFALRRD